MQSFAELKQWVAERQSYWRQNRAEDASVWARLNEDVCFLAAIERLEELQSATPHDRMRGEMS